jgi:hypothetical protein
MLAPRFKATKLDTIWDQLTQRSTHSKIKSYRNKLIENDQLAYSDRASQSSRSSLNKFPLRSHSNNFQYMTKLDMILKYGRRNISLDKGDEFSDWNRE